MKTKTFMIGLILTAVLLTPLAIAGEGEERTPRGKRFHRGFGGPQDEPFGGFQRGRSRAGMKMQRGVRGRGDMRMQQGGQDNRNRMLLGRIGDKLELTQEQKDLIKDVLEAEKEAIDASQKAVQEAMKALHEVTAEGTEAEIIAAGKAAGDALIQKALGKAAIMNAVKGVLTEEQQEELERMKAGIKERLQLRSQNVPELNSFRQGRGGRQRRIGQRGPVEENPD